MKQIFLAAKNDNFWGCTESQMHTMALRAGVIIPAKEWSALISQAKSYFFVAPNTKGPTENVVVNIAIKMWRRETLYNCFA